MQHISDKDFDKLFKDNLVDAEIEPSRDLWAAIETGLEPKKRKQLPVYWMAAAVVVVAVTAGLLFNKEEKIQLHGRKEVVQSVPEAIRPVTVLPNSRKNDEGENQLAAVKTETAGQRGMLPKIKITQRGAQATEPIAVATQLSQSKPEQQELKKTEPLTFPEIKMPVQETYIAQAEPVKNEGRENEREEHKAGGIQNIGDLVNLVVSKVDKREKKFIEFKTDEEEGSSSLASINIGFVRLNTHRHK